MSRSTSNADEAGLASRSMCATCGDDLYHPSLRRTSYRPRRRRPVTPYDCKATRDDRRKDVGLTTSSPIVNPTTSRSLSGANRPARHLEQLVDGNRRRTAKFQRRQPCADLGDVPFVWSFTKLQ